MNKTFASLVKLDGYEDTMMEKFMEDLNSQVTKQVENHLGSWINTLSIVMTWKIEKMRSEKCRDHQILEEVKSFLLMIAHIDGTKDFSDKIHKFIGGFEDGREGSCESRGRGEEVSGSETDDRSCEGRSCDVSATEQH